MPTPRIARAGAPPEIEISDFGDGAGLLLLAEYDVENDTIRVNARAIARVREAAGPLQAEAFVTCAIVHERFHRAHPNAPEDAVHEHVRRATGCDPLRFEAYVRGAAPKRW